MAYASTACAGGPTSADAVEPPPAVYASGPTQYGATVELSFDNPRQLQAFCNFYLGRPRRGYYRACYVPALDLVVIPGRGARERQALQEHEWGHARGWRHGSLRTAAAAAE